MVWYHFVIFIYQFFGKRIICNRLWSSSSSLNLLSLDLLLQISLNPAVLFNITLRDVMCSYGSRFCALYINKTVVSYVEQNLCTLLSVSSLRNGGLCFLTGSTTLISLSNNNCPKIEGVNKLSNYVTLFL